MCLTSPLTRQARQHGTSYPLLFPDVPSELFPDVIIEPSPVIVSGIGGTAMLRHAAVAGYFYQGSSAGLRDQVEHYLVPAEKRTKALGILAPHAGLVYSGPVAGAVYSCIELPGVIVLIGPNHTGLGAPVSIMAEGRWTTPLGEVAVDAPLAEAIQTRSRRIQEDSLAHLREHSLEVQLPFIQYLRKDFTIVPIQMLDTRYETCVDVGNAVAAAVKADGRETLIVASSDMSHYVSAAEAESKDRKAIARILELDARGLYNTVRDEGITMCGYGPAVAMLTACEALGATRAELVRYANSGEVSGDLDQVVGYAGVVVSWSGAAVPRSFTGQKPPTGAGGFSFAYPVRSRGH